MIPGVLLMTQVAPVGRVALGRVGCLLLGRVRKLCVVRIVELIYAVVFEEVRFQFIFRRATENLHVAARDKAEEGSVVPVDVALPLLGIAKALIIVLTIYSWAFEPVRTIALL